MDVYENRQPSRTSILGLLLVVLILRLGMVALIFNQPDRAYFPDSFQYEMLAIRILEDEGYQWEPVEDAELFRPPGYPFFVAVIYAVAGRHAGNVALAQLILTSWTCLLLYAIVNRLFSERVAFLAGILYALDPISTFWALSVLSETAFAFFVVLSLYFITRWFETSGLPWSVFAGLAAGISSLVRPIGLILLPLWCGIVMLRHCRRKKPFLWSATIRGSVVFALAGAIVVVPWAYRNYALWGVFNVSSVTIYNLGTWQAAGVLAEVEGVTLEEAQQMLGVHGTVPNPGDWERYKQIIQEHPWIYAKLHLKGTLPVLFGTEYAGWLNLFEIHFSTPGAMLAIMGGDIGRGVKLILDAFVETPQALPFIVVTLAYQITIYALALLGFIRGWQHTRLRWWIVLMAITSLALMAVPGPVGNSRFRVPAQPAMITLGALAFYGTDHRWANRDEDLQV